MSQKTTCEFPKNCDHSASKFFAYRRQASLTPSSIARVASSSPAMRAPPTRLNGCPALISNGYPRSFSIGLICASGTLGIIIPPSIPMILFGIMTETSITKLFLAGIVPGLLLAFLLAGYSVLVNRHRDRSNWDKDEILASIRSGFFALALPVLLLGGIYSGYFTPTEAAAAALVYSLIV